MVDWLTWPAELVLSAGGVVASWLVSRDSLSFVALQMGFALVVWRRSCPCLHICQRWLDIGARVHALPSLSPSFLLGFVSNTISRTALA
jgi:hypothetical protein